MSGTSKIGYRKEGGREDINEPKISSWKRSKLYFYRNIINLNIVMCIANTPSCVGIINIDCMTGLITRLIGVRWQAGSRRFKAK